MFISDFAIRRPVVTVVTMLALSVFGIFALFNLDTDEFPDVQVPIVAVAIAYPGASPESVEREILEPIEEAVSGISGVDKVNSSGLDGFAAFNVCSGRPVSILEVATELCETRGDAPPVITGQYRSGDVRHIVADPARAAQVLGFRAAVDPRDGLREFAFAPLRS